MRHHWRKSTHSHTKAFPTRIPSGVGPGGPRGPRRQGGCRNGRRARERRLRQLPRHRAQGRRHRRAAAALLQLLPSAAHLLLILYTQHSRSQHALYKPAVRPAADTKRIARSGYRALRWPTWAHVRAAAPCLSFALYPMLSPSLPFPGDVSDIVRAAMQRDSLRTLLYFVASPYYIHFFQLLSCTEHMHTNISVGY
eukprot:6208439-Pleurochrysis_carterae.AAC.1